MAQSAYLFPNVLDQALQGNINWVSDTIKCALLTANPTIPGSIHWADISAGEITGTGYSAGGTTLGTKTHTVTVANSWGITWAGTTAFAAGQLIRPAVGNGSVYMACTTGTTAAGTPTFPSIYGETVSDGGVVWVNKGSSVLVLSSASAQWTSSTISAAAAVVYDSVSGALISVQEFGATFSDTNATFQVTPDPNLGWAAWAMQ